MKKNSLVRICFSLIMIIFLSTSLMAQGPKKGSTNPIDRVNNRTDKMVEDLNLNKKQENQVRDINLKFARKIQALKNNGNDREANREEFKSLREEHKTELKNVLTEEQFQQHLAFEKERKEMRKEHKGRPSPKMSKEEREAIKDKIKPFKKESKTYFRNHIFPVLKTQRQKFDRSLSVEDRRTITALRSEAKALRDKIKTTKQSLKEQYDSRKDIPEETRNEMKQLHEQKRAIGEKSNRLQKNTAANWLN